MGLKDIPSRKMTGVKDTILLHPNFVLAKEIRGPEMIIKAEIILLMSSTYLSSYIYSY